MSILVTLWLTGCSATTLSVVGMINSINMQASSPTIDSKFLSFSARFRWDFCGLICYLTYKHAKYDDSPLNFTIVRSNTGSPHLPYNHMRQPAIHPIVFVTVKLFSVPFSLAMVTTGLDVDSSDASGKHTDECCGLPMPGKQALENPEPPPEAKLRDIKLGHWVTWLNDHFHLWKQQRSSGQPLYGGDMGDLSMDVDVAGDRECMQVSLNLLQYIHPNIVTPGKWDTSPMSWGNIPHTSLGKFHGWTLWLPPIKTFAEFHQCTVWSCTRANTCARNSSCKFHEQTLQSLATVSFTEFCSWKVQSHTRADTCARNSSYKFHEWTLQSSATIALAEFCSWNSNCKFHEQTLQSSTAIAITEFHSWNSSYKFHEWTLQSSTAIAFTDSVSGPTPVQGIQTANSPLPLQSSAHGQSGPIPGPTAVPASSSSIHGHFGSTLGLTSMEGIHPSLRQPALDKLDQKGPFLSVVSHAFKTLEENLRAEFAAICEELVDW
ncbi:hypothetical protein F5J12DRAFT_786547 [Pisolithus orientalis]|uniref:uncharacterized protein n=1 Tax=Pisolithus orientalis TaxID=936130 RepID=UPI00222516CB|nr:uncharacterized protein F5J12DRAFT_786547 [Pisolithus orientalis]KAI5990330.1 hypothetical protein F5J12DRAFT_786547 [Pisolithus orientalis]